MIKAAALFPTGQSELAERTRFYPSRAAADASWQQLLLPLTSVLVAPFLVDAATTTVGPSFFPPPSFPPTKRLRRLPPPSAQTRSHTTLNLFFPFQFQFATQTLFFRPAKMCFKQAAAPAEPAATEPALAGPGCAIGIGCCLSWDVILRGRRASKHQQQQQQQQPPTAAAATPVILAYPDPPSAAIVRLGALGRKRSKNDPSAATSGGAGKQQSSSRAQRQHSHPHSPNVNAL
jgi:hypothetical protein